MIRKSLFVFLVCIFVGCGYKPVSHYARENIKTVYIQVEVNSEYPENHIVAKNKLTSLLSDKMQVKIRDKKENAQSYIFMKIHDIEFVPIEYKKGFISQYRVDVSIQFDYKRIIDTKPQIKIIKAKYDFSASEATLYNKLQRDEKSLSVDAASVIAIEKFIASIIL